MRHTSTGMNNSHGTDMPLSPELYAALDKGKSLVEQELVAFSHDADTVHTTVNQAFSLEIDAPLSLPLVTSLQSGQIDWPQIRVVSTANLNGANGGFSGLTNTIYLASEFLERHRGEQERIADLLLEEYGHALDYRFNSTDAPGDEGAIFSALVQGHELTTEPLQALRSENDATTVLIDGTSLEIEQNTVNVTQVLNGLDDLLETLQGALESQVFAQTLPLLGDSLKQSRSNAVQFIDELRQPIRQALEVLPEDATPEQIKSALEGALGHLIQGGINVIDNVATPNDVRFELNLSQRASENQTNIPLDSELGLPGLGLDVTGSANVGLGYEIDLDFGVNQDGFYFDTSGVDDIVVAFQATAPARVTGKLGLLEVEIGDNTDEPSSLTGKFKIDLQDADDKLRISELAAPNLSNLIDAKLDESSGADLNLKLKTRVIGAEALPSIGTELNVDWAFGNAPVDPSQSLTNFGETPTVVYKNIQLYLDSFFDKFAGPILNTVQDVLEPVQPIIETLLTPIDLGVVKFTLLDIARQLRDESGNSIISDEDEEFIQSAASLLRLIQDLPENSEGGINLGQEFNLGDIRKPDFDRKKLELPDFSGFDLSSQLTGREAEQSFYAGLKTHPGEGLKFPILDDPSQAFNLLLGNYDEIELFQYDLPKLDFEASYSQFFPIIGPLGPNDSEAVRKCK